MTKTNRTGFFRSLRFRYGVGILVLLGIAVYLLWDEHKPHIIEYLPIIPLVGMCLGMHKFMHGGHGRGHGGSGDGHK